MTRPKDDRQPIPIPPQALSALRNAIVYAQDAAAARDDLIRGIILGMGQEPGADWELDPEGWLRPIVHQTPQALPPEPDEDSEATSVP